MKQPLQNPYIPEPIAVIGGGLAGCYAALFAARQRVTLSDGSVKPRYHVTLIEKDRVILNGSSVIAAQMHLGGEYPKDVKTGRHCLKGAVITNLIWGSLARKNARAPNSSIYTNQPPMRFTITEETEKSKRLTVKEFGRYYESMRKTYAELLDKVQQAKGWNIAETENALFGSANPGEFFRKLEKAEIDVYYNPSHPSPGKGKRIIGGFQTQEPGLNMPLYLDAIEKALSKENVEIKINTEVKTLQKNGDGTMTLVLGKTDAPPHSLYKDEITARQIVIAASDGGPAVEEILGTELTKPPTIYRRAMLLVDTIGGSKVKYPPMFVMDPGKENAAMWRPYSDHCGAVYFPPMAYMGKKKISPGDTGIGPHDHWEGYKGAIPTPALASDCMSPPRSRFHTLPIS